MIYFSWACFFDGDGVQRFGTSFDFRSGVSRVHDICRRRWDNNRFSRILNNDTWRIRTTLRTTSTRLSRCSPRSFGVYQRRVTGRGKGQASTYYRHIDRALTERYGIDDDVHVTVRNVTLSRAEISPRAYRLLKIVHVNYDLWNIVSETRSVLLRSVIMDFAPCTFPMMRRVATAESWNWTVTRRCDHAIDVI